MILIKELLRGYLLTHQLNESAPMAHFKERVDEVLYTIESIEIPSTCYLPNIPKEAQDAYVITQIQEQVQLKIDMVINKDYPSEGGVCVLVPLGLIKVQPISGPAYNVMIKANRHGEIKVGHNYNVGVYDNRLPTLLLPDPKHPNNSSPGKQLQAHIDNTIKSGYPVNKGKSFIDKSFMNSIIIQMKNFK